METENKDNKYNLEQMQKEGGYKLPQEEFAAEINAGRDEAFKETVSSSNDFANQEEEMAAAVTANKESEQAASADATANLGDTIDTNTSFTDGTAGTAGTMGTTTGALGSAAGTMGIAGTVGTVGTTGTAGTSFPASVAARENYADANEEFAAEAAISDRTLNQPEDERPMRTDFGMNNENDAVENRTWGWAALIVAVASLFLWSSILGPVAAVMGFVAFIRGSRALGIWSIVIGLIAFVAYLILVPLYS